MTQLENLRMKVFRAAAEHLNFRKSAEHLLLTQPAVAQQMPLGRRPLVASNWLR